MLDRARLPADHGGAALKTQVFLSPAWNNEPTGAMSSMIRNPVSENMVVSVGISSIC